MHAVAGRIALGLALCACHTASAPAIPLSTTGVGHPAGVINTRIPSIDGRPFGIRVSANNLLAVTQQDRNAITLLQVSGGGPRRTVPVGADPGEVIFNRAGTTAFVSGFNDGSVRLLNSVTGTSGAPMIVGQNAYRLALSPDETRLYVSSTDGTLYVLGQSGAPFVASTLVGGPLQGLAVGTDGEYLYVTSTRGRVSRLSATTLRGGTSVDVGGAPQDLAVSRDGKEIVVSNEHGWVDVLDGTTLATIQRIPLPGIQPFGLAISPDDAQIWLTSPSTGQVVAIDRAKRTVVRVIAVGGVPRRIAFTRDGLVAVVANEDGWVDVIK